MNASRVFVSEALRSWRVAPPADPNFRQGVWQRISKKPSATLPSYLRAHAATLSLASSVVLAAAAYGGSALARFHTRADREAIVKTYLVDLDPRIQAVLKP